MSEQLDRPFISNVTQIIWALPYWFSDEQFTQWGHSRKERVLNIMAMGYAGMVDVNIEKHDGEIRAMITKTHYERAYSLVTLNPAMLDLSSISIIDASRSIANEESRKALEKAFEKAKEVYESIDIPAVSYGVYRIESEGVK